MAELRPFPPHPDDVAWPTAVWEEAPPKEVQIEAVKLGGVAISIGMVVWALRTGGLLASLVASVPIWMRFDPLPILVFDDDEDEHDGPDWGLRSDADTAREEQAARDLFRSGRSTSRSVMS